MSVEDRQEISCKCCGKSRMLSLLEADQDGWVFSTEYSGLICSDCVSKYGIPSIFMGSPVRVLGTEGGGCRIEYDNHSVRGVSQVF